MSLWFLSSSLKYKWCVFPAKFGLENLCFPQLPGGEKTGQLFRLKIPGGRPEFWAGVLLRMSQDVSEESEKEQR